VRFEPFLRQLNGGSHQRTVYVLRGLKSGWFYIGMTNDLARRLCEHNSGYNCSTRGKGSFIVLRKEEFATRVEARRRERELKSGQGREFLRDLYR